MEIKSDDAKPLIVMAVSPECHAGFARLFSGDTVKVIPITDIIQGAEADVFVTDDPQELASIADHYSKQFEGWVVRKMHWRLTGHHWKNTYVLDYDGPKVDYFFAGPKGQPPHRRQPSVSSGANTAKLMAPGTYYDDTVNGKLYYRLKEGEDIEDLHIEVGPAEDDMVSLPADHEAHDRKVHVGFDPAQPGSDITMMIRAEREAGTDKIIYEPQEPQDGINRGPKPNRKKGRHGRQFRG